MGVAIVEVVIHEVGVVVLQLLSQHLCVERRIHCVLYDADLLPLHLSRHTNKTGILYLHLKDNLLRLCACGGGGGLGGRGGGGRGGGGGGGVWGVEGGREIVFICEKSNYILYR